MLEVALASAITSIVLGQSVRGNSISRPEPSRCVAVAPGVFPGWQHTALQAQVTQLEELPSGWDGDDAERISAAAAHAAKVFIGAFPGPSMPSIYPNSSGTISMEWDSPLGEAVLEIGESRYSFYLSPSNGEASYKKGTAQQLWQEAALISESIEARLFPARAFMHPALVNVRLGMGTDERIAA